MALEVDYPFKNFMQKHTVDEVVAKKKEVVTGDDSTTVEQALSLLNKNNIISLPIVKGKEFVGILNIIDILLYIAFQKLSEEEEKQGPVFENAKVLSTKVIDLVGLSEESKTIWSFNSTDKIEVLLNPLSKGVHRALVKFPDGTAKLLTQTDLLRFLAQHSKDLAGNIMHAPISGIGLVNPKDKKNILSISNKSKAIEGFQLLARENINSLPVLDDKGVCVASLSSGDLRGVGRKDLAAYLSKPILEFLQAVSHEIDDKGKPVIGSVKFTCVAKDSLSEVLNTLVGGRLHSLYVVDEASKPVGVVTMSDIVSKFSPFDYKTVDFTDRKSHEEFLNAHSVGQLIKERKPIIAIAENASMRDLLSLLHTNNIISAPVVDKNGKPIGIVNVFDILTYTSFCLVFQIEPSKVTEAAFEKQQSLDITAKDFLGISEESRQLWTVERDSPLIALLSIFTKGVHRVLVNNDGGYRFLSQTDVIRFLNDNLHQLGKTPERTLNELGLLKNKNQVVTIEEKATTLDAFRRMAARDCSAVAILDDTGKIVANVSASDVRGLSADNLKLSLLPPLQFLHKTRGEVPKVVTCLAGDKISNVIKKVVENHLHRVWVVDDKGKPTSIVTLSDIINVFAPDDPSGL